MDSATHTGQSSNPALPEHPGSVPTERLPQDGNGLFVPVSTLSIGRFDDGQSWYISQAAPMM
jgi:hypothetical protein